MQQYKSDKPAPSRPFLHTQGMPKDPATISLQRNPELPPRSENRQQDESIGNELRRIRKQSWGNRGSLARTAEMAGVSVALLSLVERGEHPLAKVRAETLERLPEAYGLTASEFSQLTGMILVRPNGVPAAGELPEMRQYPIYRLPSKTMGPNDVGQYEILTQQTATVSLLVVEVGDDSMNPELHKGDRVYVDRQAVALVEDKIYLVQTGDGFMLRRILTVADEKLLLADNRQFTPIKLGRSVIIGRAYEYRPHNRPL